MKISEVLDKEEQKQIKDLINTFGGKITRITEGPNVIYQNIECFESIKNTSRNRYKFLFKKVLKSIN